MHLSRQQCIWVPPHYHFFGFLLLSSFDDRAANEIKDMKYVFILLSWIDFKFLFPTGCAPLKGSKLRRLIGKRAGKVQPTSEEFLREKTSKLRLNNGLQSIFWLSIVASWASKHICHKTDVAFWHHLTVVVHYTLEWEKVWSRLSAHLQQFFGS